MQHSTRQLDCIAFFCGSSFGVRDVYRQSAAEFAAHVARQGIGIVFGGGHVGLMGTVADAALQAGGRVYGVIPRALEESELAHEGLTRLEVVADMHERKARMAELSDGFVALPGGIGTLEELFEVWTWAQLGLHEKPVALYNVEGFFDPLRAFIDQMVGEGFLKAEFRDMLVVSDSLENILEQFRAYQAPHKKWT
ncbi:TIGR00730 family Rossman fold protein [Marinobacteraceae bacterium S3BR75-40.1]